jgi:predicted transcriptional regulator
MKTEVKNGTIVYKTRAWYKLTSKKYAKTLTKAIEQTKNQMQATRDTRKKEIARAVAEYKIVDRTS